MIVLNEYEWAKDVIASRSLGKKPSETLYRVARYYLDNGLDKKEVRKTLDKFLIQCDPSASLTKWSDSLDFALNRALKNKTIMIDSIVITEPEWQKIRSVNGRQAQRLAFTLLCLAKYWNTVNAMCNGWVNNKDSEIMSMANINTSIKRQSLMYHTLRESGLIQFSKKIDNTNVRVCFIEDGEPTLYITDFRNLGYQYLRNIGEPYYVCECCGITTKVQSRNKDCHTKQGPGRPPKYCKDCATKVHLKQKVNSVMRRQKTSKSE